MWPNSCRTCLICTPRFLAHAQSAHAGHPPRMPRCSAPSPENRAIWEYPMLPRLPKVLERGKLENSSRARFQGARMRVRGLGDPAQVEHKFRVLFGLCLCRTLSAPVCRFMHHESALNIKFLFFILCPRSVVLGPRTCRSLHAGGAPCLCAARRRNPTHSALLQSSTISQ